MGSNNAKEQGLPEFLKAGTAEILERWMAMTQPQLSLPPSRELSFDEFRNDVPEVLQNLADFLNSRRDAGESPQFNEVVCQHGHCRWQQGFNLKDLIRDWGNLQRIVLEWVNDFYEDEAARESIPRGTATNLVTAFFTEAVCGSVARFDELRQDDAARMTSDLQRMRDHFKRIDDFRKRLLKDLSHDMRSPLTAISGASSILKNEEEEEEEEEEEGAGDHEAFHELGAIIDESVNDAMELLNALRELSDIDSGAAKLAPSRIDVAALLREVVHERLAPSEGETADPTLKVSGPESLQAEADPAKLRKTFESLFLPAIGAGQAKPASVEAITLRPGEDQWELQVRYASTRAGKEERGEAPPDNLDTIILRRLCFIQLASFQCERSPAEGQTATLKFPLDYRDLD